MNIPVISPPTLYHYNQLWIRKLSARVQQSWSQKAASSVAIHVCFVYKRNGIDGLWRMLSEVSNGKVRVTKSERILMAIAEFLHLIHDGWNSHTHSRSTYKANTVYLLQDMVNIPLSVSSIHLLARNAHLVRDCCILLKLCDHYIICSFLDL